jgi:hypothetical protein
LDQADRAHKKQKEKGPHPSGAHFLYLASALRLMLARLVLLAGLLLLTRFLATTLLLLLTGLLPALLLLLAGLVLILLIHRTLHVLEGLA